MQFSDYDESTVYVLRLLELKKITASCTVIIKPLALAGSTRTKIDQYSDYNYSVSIILWKVADCCSAACRSRFAFPRHSTWHIMLLVVANLDFTNEQASVLGPRSAAELATTINVALVTPILVVAVELTNADVTKRLQGPSAVVTGHWAGKDGGRRGWQQAAATWSRWRWCFPR